MAVARSLDLRMLCVSNRFWYGVLLNYGVSSKMQGVVRLFSVMASGWREVVPEKAEALTALMPGLSCKLWMRSATSGSLPRSGSRTERLFPKIGAELARGSRYASFNFVECFHAKRTVINWDAVRMRQTVEVVENLPAMCLQDEKSRLAG